MVNDIPYGLYPIVDWYPAGDTYRIGSVSGDELFVSLNKYKGDENQLFVLKQPLISDAVPYPFHRLDITFPSFSEDVIDTVRLNIYSNIIHRNSMKSKEINISDPTTIKKIAYCFLNPITANTAKKFDDYTSINFSAESDQYKNISYELKVVVYDGKYCFLQRDGTMYEIPLQLLEEIFDLDIYTPQEYLTAEETKREWLGEKWRSVSENGTFYLFMWMNDYIIIEAKDEKPILKESGLYKLDNDTLYFQPDENQLAPYSFKLDLEKMCLTLLSSGISYDNWKYDEESSVYLEYRNSSYSIDQIASEYMGQVNHARYNNK